MNRWVKLILDPFTVRRQVQPGLVGLSNDLADLVRQEFGRPVDGRRYMALSRRYRAADAILTTLRKHPDELWILLVEAEGDRRYGR